MEAILSLLSSVLQSIHSEEVCKRPSTIPTPVIQRKLPKKRDFSIDEMQDFKENDTISSFEEHNEKHSPPGFQFSKTDYCVLYYNLQFDEKTSFPKVLECIRVVLRFHYRCLNASMIYFYRFPHTNTKTCYILTYETRH